MKFQNCCIVALAFAASASLNASTFDAIYSFGDSLSDAGNVYVASGGTIPGSSYYHGTFTNGPLWVQDLAVKFGLPPVTPSLAGGSDYAYGSAQSGVTTFNPAAPYPSFDLTGATGQVAQFQATHSTADPNALYTIWIGSNDLGSIPPTATATQLNADLSQITGNIDSAIATLAGAGAKNFLIVNVPNLGLTPLGASIGPEATLVSGTFDYSFLDPSLATIPGASSLNLSVLDTFGLLDAVVHDPGSFGLSNVTDPCLTGVDYANYSGGTPCSDPASYLFWDREHPSAAGQALIADAAFAELSAPTPEPASLLLAATGLAGVLLGKRRIA